MCRILRLQTNKYAAAQQGPPLSAKSQHFTLRPRQRSRLHRFAQGNNKGENIRGQGTGSRQANSMQRIKKNVLTRKNTYPPFFKASTYTNTTVAQQTKNHCEAFGQSGPARTLRNPGLHVHPLSQELFIRHRNHPPTRPNEVCMITLLIASFAN